MNTFDFALQWLDFLGVSIYNKGSRVLEYKGDPKYDISPLDTKIKIGQRLGDEADQEKEPIIMSYIDIDRIGLTIKVFTDIKWKHAQRAAYALVSRTKNVVGITYDNFKKSGMKIQHDPDNKRVRLIGENVIADPHIRKDSGVGPWIIYDEDAPKNYIPRKVKAMSSEDIKMALMSRKFGGGTSNNSEFIEINDIPVLISDEKYIVCIRKEDTCQRILCTGASGMGKSTIVNAISGKIFYKWGDRIGWLIDPLNQFYNISAEQDFGEFNKLNALINDMPKPIPAVHMYLACKYPEIIVHKNISFKLTLSFMEFLNKYTFYTYGTKDWKLEGSERYLKAVLDKMKNASTSEELEAVFYEAIPQANDKKANNLRSMIFKWTNTFNSIFREKFTSNLYKDDPLATDDLTVKFKDGNKISGHPFIMAMEAGLVPVINTSIVPDKPWVRNYLADVMQKIMIHQKTMGSLRTRKWIIVDEMQAIYEESAGKARDNATNTFESLFRQGRLNDIGFVGNTQSL